MKNVNIDVSSCWKWQDIAYITSFYKLNSKEINPNKSDNTHFDSFQFKRLLLTSRALEKYQLCIYYRYLFGLVLDGYLWIQVSFHGYFLKVDTSALILEGKNGQICANPDKGEEIRTKETLICLELINLSIFAWICPFLRNLSIFAEFVRIAAS